MVTTVVGEEGTGKSLWWISLARDLTLRGKTVIVMASEDDEDYMLGPRMEAAGVDMGFVFVVDPDSNGRRLTLPSRQPEMVGLIRESGAVAVFADPWISAVDQSLRVKDPQDARRALDPMTVLAKDTGVAFVAVVHPNRGEGSMRDRVGLTSVLRQVSRSLLWVIADPDDPAVLYVGQEKSNLGPRAQVSNRYRIHTRSVPMDDGNSDTLPYLLHDGQEDRPIWQVDADFHASTNPSDDPKAWLRLRLADGPVVTDRVKDEAKALGISGYSLDRAAKDLRIIKAPLGHQQPWAWHLPLSAAESAESPESAESDIRRLCADCGEPMIPTIPEQATHPRCGGGS